MQGSLNRPTFNNHLSLSSVNEISSSLKYSDYSNSYKYLNSITTIPLSTSVQTEIYHNGKGNAALRNTIGSNNEHKTSKNYFNLGK
jgi:hypothetical protein